VTPEAVDSIIQPVEKYFMDVKTAGRTIDVFEAFARERTPLSLSDLARTISTPVSSCFNLVRALEARGYLYAVGARPQIYPSRKLFEVASAIIANEPWMKRLEPVLAALRQETEETIILGKRQNDRALYLAVFEGSRTIRYTANVGDLKPLHSSSIGKALLSALEPAERASVVGRLPLAAITAATVTDGAALLAELEASARRGYAETRGENVADVMAIAQPVRLGREAYAIAIAGPMHRMLAEAEQHRARLCAACARIAAAP
jgi:DNA-binding IclR family transcriptional regulator